MEYIGEEEPTLVDFICQKIMLHSTPSDIMTDVQMVSFLPASFFFLNYISQLASRHARVTTVVSA